MKKQILLSLTILFIGCNSDNSLNEQNTKITDENLQQKTTVKETSSNKTPSAEKSIIEKIGSKLFTPATKETPAPPIVTSARKQIGKTIMYDPKYVGLSYPNGDVPLSRGVCTDVVIRAMRDSMKIDLQKEVHEDMKRAFSTYPKIWGAKSTDTNIDHRRVPNLQNYFKRKGYALAVTKNPADYKAGDIVTCKVQGRPHIMIVSSKQTREGVPFVIHNIGWGTKENNSLFSYKLDGHYRVK